MCRSSSTQLRELLSRLDIVMAHPTPYNNSTTSPRFYEQLADFLRGNEYQDVLSLQREGLA